MIYTKLLTKSQAFAMRDLFRLLTSLEVNKNIIHRMRMNKPMFSYDNDIYQIELHVKD